MKKQSCSENKLSMEAAENPTALFVKKLIYAQIILPPHNSGCSAVQFSGLFMTKCFGLNNFNLAEIRNIGQKN